jgi:hypothetical protein
MRLALRPHLPQQHYTHLKMKTEKETCYERRAYVQERRRNPCDQLCKMYDHGRGHDT